MADSYVCSGAMMKCTMGTSPARLTVLPIRTVFLTGQPMANISDHQTMVNLAPFGLCRSLAFPATASATAAALGTLTPMPCMHNTPFPWIGGKMDYLVKGQPALLKTSKCQCLWGGTISLVNDGQVGEGTQWREKKPTEIFSSHQEQFSLGDNVLLFTIASQNAISKFSDNVSVAGEKAKTEMSSIIGNFTKQVINKTKEILADASKQVYTAFSDVSVSALNVVHKIISSTIGDGKALAAEIISALTDKTLLDIVKNEVEGIANAANSNAISILVLNMYQSGITGGKQEVINALNKQYLSNKKKHTEELSLLFERYIVSHQTFLLRMCKLAEFFHSKAKDNGTIKPDMYDLISLAPQIIGYVVSIAGDEGKELKDKIIGLNSILNEMALEKYVETKNFIDCSAPKFYDSILQTGNEFLCSISDAVGSLIGDVTVSMKINN